MGKIILDNKRIAGSHVKIAAVRIDYEVVKCFSGIYVPGSIANNHAWDNIQKTELHSAAVMVKGSSRSVDPIAHNR